MSKLIKESLNAHGSLTVDSKLCPHDTLLSRCLPQKCVRIVFFRLAQITYNSKFSDELFLDGNSVRAGLISLKYTHFSGRFKEFNRK